MKSEKGVTLISLISYVIVLLLVVSAVTLTTNFLMNNMNETQKKSENISQINKFDLAFLKDIKQENISIYKISDDKRSIILEDQIGNDIQYIYSNNSIYRIENTEEKIRVNEKIEDFEIVSAEGSKIEIKITVDETSITKQYKLGKY